MNTPPQVLLRILNGDLQGQTFPVGAGLVVGRANTCAVFVPDGRASREHLELSFEDGRLIARDLKSHNGTFLNGVRMESSEVHPGDVVRIGTTLLGFEIAKASAESAVKVVQGSHDLEPRLVRSMDPISGPVVASRINAEDYLASLGVSQTITTDASTLQLLRKTRHFAILTEVSRALQRYSDLQESLPGILDLVLQVLRADAASVVLLDDEGRLVPNLMREREDRVGVQVETFRSGEISEARVISKTIADKVLKERCAVITADASTDERFATADSVVINNVRSLMVVPILVSDEMLGFVEFENRRSVSAFDETDLHFASVMGSMVGIALNHLRMQQSRERVIQQLQAARDQLLATQQRLIIAERMGTLGRLASGIAHEVKNHLSPLLLADLIAHKYPEDSEICEASEMMLEAQRRILGLVDEIRQFAGGGRGSVQLAPCDLSDLVNGVLRFITCDRSMQSVHIRAEHRQEPLVNVDSGRIRQVLINLIRNASEAMGGQGTIEVVVDASSHAATVSVRDSGPGIPKDVQDRIFEPFFTTKGERGLGLGLDISRQIIRAHGGSLVFTSTLGVGSEFSVILPMQQDSDADEPRDSAPEFSDLATDAGHMRFPTS